MVFVFYLYMFFASFDIIVSLRFQS